MSLLDDLVEEALRARADLNTLRPVVEKELLHHDILREMSGAGLLADLTFIGGTCLRACYGSQRLSEDLDFTGGAGFERKDLSSLAAILTERLNARYDLPVRVNEPVKTEGRVSTWKLLIETRPGRRHLPAQRIHLDICAIPSHDPRPMMLRNLYGVDLGTSGLILQAQSREEILADKFIALPEFGTRCRAIRTISQAADARIPMLGQRAGKILQGPDNRAGTPSLSRPVPKCRVSSGAQGGKCTRSKK